MSQGLFSNRILATNRQKKITAARCSMCTPAPQPRRHQNGIYWKRCWRTPPALVRMCKVQEPGHWLRHRARTDAKGTLKLRRSSELAAAGAQNRGQSRATKLWRHMRAKPDAEGKTRRWDCRRRIGEAGGMATPMITRLASLAEYVVVPGAILVAYFTTRGSAPVKKESRK